MDSLVSNRALRDNVGVRASWSAKELLALPLVEGGRQLVYTWKSR